MKESQGRMTGRGVPAAMLLGLLVLLVPAAWAGGGGAVVSGVVKDAQGVAQMGALIQVVGPNSITVATAFTDQHGHYAIAHLSPGRYMVRASQTLYVAATRGNLQLQAGTTAVVNLTVAALFDMASWLPAERRSAGEPDDDWKWALRSSANRPILRMVDDNGQIVGISSSAAERRPDASANLRATVASGDGGFGEGGVHNIVAMRKDMADGTEVRLRADLGTVTVPAGARPSQQLDAGVERHLGFAGATRTVIAYSAHPELLGSGDASGVTVVKVGSAQRFNLADLLELEAGGTVEAVHAGAFGLASRPFVRVTAHLGGEWTLRYRFATERETQSFDDLTPGNSSVPVALVRNGKLELEQGRHHEVTFARRAGRGGVELVYFHDALKNTVLSGGGASGPGNVAMDRAPGEMLVDPTTGTFRTLGRGYAGDGGRLTVSAPLTTGLWIAAEYSVGDALVSETGTGATFRQSLAATAPKGSQAATVAVKGHLAGLGTQVRASYRWQQARLLSAVDPYSAFADQAYFSCRVRQPIRLGQRLPQGMAATIDVTNLLAEGYRPFVSEDGQTLYFAQAPRTIQAGLSFSF